MKLVVDDRLVSPADLVGFIEAADLLGVSKQTIHNWRKKHDDFPVPVAELRMGPVWVSYDLLEWAKSHNLTK